MCCSWKLNGCLLCSTREWPIFWVVTVFITCPSFKRLLYVFKSFIACSFHNLCLLFLLCWGWLLFYCSHFFIIFPRAEGNLNIVLVFYRFITNSISSEVFGAPYIYIIWNILHFYFNFLKLFGFYNWICNHNPSSSKFNSFLAVLICVCFNCLAFYLNIYNLAILK